MKSIHLVLISLIFCLLYLAFKDVSEYLDAICIALIIIVGLPHGAVDNHLLIKPLSSLPSFIFHSIYSGLLILYLIFWFLFPIFSFIFFLILTSYHFGEAYVRDFKLNTLPKTLLNFSTGFAFISALILLNLNEFNGFLLSQTVMEFNKGIEFNFMLFVFIGSNTLTVFLVLMQYDTIHLKLIDLMKEALSILLLYFSFYYLDFLKSFTLFFVFWHSFDVLQLVFNFLKNENKIFGLHHFIKLMFPNYMISLVLGAVLFVIIKLFNIELTMTSIIFLFLASLTLPHTVVMSLFNNSSKNEN